MRSVSIPQLYSNLYRRLIQVIPDGCDSRITNLALLMMGIVKGQSVQVGKIAAHLPIRAKKQSLIRRLERFLDNGAVRVRAWYEGVAKDLLAVASVAGEVHLIIDSTQVSFNHQLLLVALAYRRCALPIAWTWVRHKRGHSTMHKQLALLSYVRTLLPNGVKVSLVGDCEFGHSRIIQHLREWQWDYALRESGNTLVGLYEGQTWLRLDELLPHAGTFHWFGFVQLTACHAQATHLFACWKRGERTPWLLATNFTRPSAILRLYARRMWIEELFVHLKGQGFDLESSHLRTFLHLSRLTLAVALLAVWLLAFGAELVQDGLRAQVDRSSRRDLSLFRIAWDYLQQLLAWGDPFDVSFCPFFGPLPSFSPAGYPLPA
jgi:Transposase DDE domain